MIRPLRMISLRKRQRTLQQAQGGGRTSLTQMMRQSLHRRFRMQGARLQGLPLCRLTALQTSL